MMKTIQRRTCVIICFVAAAMTAICRLASAQIVVSGADGTRIPAVDGLCKFDFGQVNAADTAAASRNFLLTNTSDRPLSIARVVTSCGCTSTTLTSNGVGTTVGGLTLLPSHAQITLSVKIDTGRLMSGQFDKFVWVYLEGSRTPAVSMEAIGSLDRLVALEPGSIDFGTVSYPADSERTITATVNPSLLSKVDPTSLRLAADTPGYVVTGPTILRDAALPDILRLSYKLNITESAAWGESATALRFASTGDSQTDKALKIYVVPVAAHIVGPINAIPSIIAFSSVSVKHVLPERTALLTVQPGKTIRTFVAVTGSPSVTARIVAVPGSNGRRGILVVALKGSSQPGAIDTNISVLQKREPAGKPEYLPGRLVLPVYGYVTASPTPF